MSDDVAEREFSTDQREKLAKKGYALPDGSFPIVTVEDLSNAIHAFGRASNKEAAKSHIIKRAKALGHQDMIPDNWDEADTPDESGTVESVAVDDSEVDSLIDLSDAVTYVTSESSTTTTSNGSNVTYVTGTTVSDIQVTVAPVEESAEEEQVEDPETESTDAEPVPEATEEVAEEESTVEEADCPCEGDECPYEHQDVAEAVTDEWFVEADSGVIESALDGGNSYRVTMIESGISKNRNYWSPRVLQSSYRMFEGTKAYADHPSKEDMVNRPERSIKDIIGWYENARYIPTSMGGKITANLHLLEGPIAAMVQEAQARGKPDLIQLSVNISGKRQPKMVNGIMTREVSEIHRVHSVDAVTEASAGGSIDQLVASANHTKEVEELMSLDNISPEDLLAAIEGREDLKAAVTASLKSTAGDDQGSKETTTESSATQTAEDSKAIQDEIRQGLEELKQERAIARSEKALTEALRTSGLPGPVQAKLEKRYANRVFDPADLTADIEDEKATLEALEQARTAAAPPESVPWRTEVGSGESSEDRWSKAMDGMIAGQTIEGVKPFSNLRHAYFEITGRNPFYQSPYEVLEAARGYDSGEFNRHLGILEANMNTTQFAKILGDSITRRALVEYQYPALQEWKKVAKTAPVSDLRQQLRNRLGEFHLLRRESSVNAGEAVTYADLTGQPLPEDEAKYQPLKADGTAALTIEMVINDDLGKFQKIPVALGRSAAATIYVTVFDFLRDNPAESTYLTTAGAAGVRLFSRSGTRAPGNVVTDARSTNDTVVALNDANLTDAKVRFRTAQAATSTAVPYANARKHSYILANPANLFVAPSNEAAAIRLRNSDQTVGGSLNDVNVHKGTFDITVIPYWEVTSGAGNYTEISGATGTLSHKNIWVLGAAPSDIPIIEVGFLNGREDPEIFVQDGPLLGEMFTKDVITYKVRHFWGANPVDHRGLVAATNTS